MIAEELLQILVCPESKQPVRLMARTDVDKINERIREGRLLNRAGKKMTEQVGDVLIREDGQRAYPVYDDIPVMLIEESFSVDCASIQE